jgi:hypothetical protein
MFVGVFSFFWGRSKSLQALFHYCLPLLDFLGQVKHFYKSFCVVLIDTYFKPLQKNSLDIVYWQALENTLPKQIP